MPATPCPTCGSPLPGKPRGVTGSEVLGVIFLGAFTCGLGWIFAPGLLLLASRKVCPTCAGPR